MRMRSKFWSLWLRRRRRLPSGSFRGWSWFSKRMWVWSEAKREIRTTVALGSIRKGLSLRYWNLGQGTHWTNFKVLLSILRIRGWGTSRLICRGWLRDRVKGRTLNRSCNKTSRRSDWRCRGRWAMLWTIFKCRVRTWEKCLQTLRNQALRKELMKRANPRTLTTTLKFSLRKIYRESWTKPNSRRGRKD